MNRKRSRRPVRTLAVCVLLLACWAPSASAGVYNLVPADASEDPQDSFRADDALFFYATVDIKGGRVCIVGPDADADSASCDAPAWGSPNTIGGLGTTYSLAEGPYLRVGTWRLAAETIPLDEGEEPVVTSVSEPFTVSPCGADCDTTLSSGIVNEFKSAAQTRFGAYYVACAAMALHDGFKDLHSQFTGAISGKLLLDKLKDELKIVKKKWDFGSGSVSVYVGIGGISAGVSFLSPEDVIRTGEKKAIEILKKLTCTLGATYADIANDPPDPDYAQVEEPTTRDVVPLGDAATDALARSSDDELGLGLAELTALERYQAAQAAGDETAAHKQVAALARTGYDLVEQARTSADRIRAYAAMLDTKPEFDDPLIEDQAELDALKALHQRITEQGFTAQERADLEELGFTPDDIQNVREQYGFDISGLTPGDTYQAGLRRVADQLDTAVAGMDEFARAAEAVAGATDQPPVADFTSSASSQNPRQMTFSDATVSPDGDRIESVEWDFGDGATGDGAQAAHTYAQDGFFIVTVRACDHYACAQFARSVNVGPPPPGRGTVVIREATSPPEPADPRTSFAYVATLPGSASFGLADGDELRETADAGEYLVDAAAQPGYVLEAVDCDDGASATPSSGSAATARATVRLDEGETVTCTFRHRLLGTPVAAFTATPLDGRAPLAVDFDASASTDDDGTIAAYAWDFGDGSSGTGKTASHTYTSSGTFTAKLEVTDDDGGTATATREITVRAPNRAPAPFDDNLPVTGAGVVDVIDNDFDPDEDRLTLVSAADPPHGTADCAAIGSCRYVPDDGYTGSDSFAYTVRDPDGLEGSATVLVEVTAPPALRTVLARGDRASTRQDEAVTVEVLANDDGEDLELTGTPEAQHGEVSCEPDGSCRYEPDEGFAGSDGFRYTAADGDGHSDEADVRIVVAAAGTGYALSLGKPGPPGVMQGQRARWTVGVRPTPADADDEALAALAPPAVTAELTGAQQADAASVRTARGWTADPPTDGGRVLHARAGAGALLGAASETFARPLPPINQGLGGDGHVAILMGSKVYAFFHLAHPTSVTCLDRVTGAVCPGYPVRLTFDTSSLLPGPAAVVGTRIYTHLMQPATFGSQHRAISLFCWDTATTRPCGLTIVDRMPGGLIPGGSPVVLVDGKLHFASDTGKLYCVDPATNGPCATPWVQTGLGEELGPDYDIVAHGTRVYVSRNNGKVACVDVAAGARCAGWAIPKDFGSRWNLVNRFDATGKAVGICVIDGRAGDCLLDAAPASVTPITGWPSLENYWGNVQEAETGTRTFVGGFPYAGMGCWDWTTMAPCTGHGYDQDGWLTTDIDGNALPSAYGGVWDGACVVALGDPGLVFTLDPSAGVSPCAGLQGTRRTVDLRDQRCDGTVGAARWKQVLLADAAPGELASVTVTVRDGATGAALATKELTGGALDLSGIDAVAHPAVTIEANTASTAGDPAWDDAIPPRIRLTWQPDPKQLCFEATTAPECEQPLAPLGLKAGLDGQAGKLEEQVPLLRAPCPPVLAAVADRTVDEETPLALALAGSDPNGGVLGYSLLEGPAGARVDPATGALAWTPSEAQGPATHTVTVRVSDPGGLHSERAFRVTVAEVNRPPALEAIADVALAAGVPLELRASASDPDLPANALSFSLADAPAGASVDAATGAIRWPSPPPGAHRLTVRVTDSGSPALSAERSFAVTAAAPAGDVRGEQSAGDQLLACSDRSIVLEDVVAGARRVSLLGVADRSFAGRTVELFFAATRKVVARAVVGADGRFAATAPLPPKRLRASNAARYEARIGTVRSKSLKLARRMVVTAIRAAAGKVTVSGRVIGPLAKRKADRAIVLERRVTCSKLERAGVTQPRRDGGFTITVPAPAGGAGAVYRLRTKVPLRRGSPKVSGTFTLPRTVDFG